MSSDAGSVASSIPDQDPVPETNGDLESEVDDDLFGDGDDDIVEESYALPIRSTE